MARSIGVGPCYRETGAYFGYGQQGDMIWDCPKNKEDKQKPKVKARCLL